MHGGREIYACCGGDTWSGFPSWYHWEPGMDERYKDYNAKQLATLEAQFIEATKYATNKAFCIAILNDAQKRLCHDMLIKYGFELKGEGWNGNYQPNTPLFFYLRTRLDQGAKKDM